MPMYGLFLDQAFGKGLFALFHDGSVVETRCLELNDARQPCAIFGHILEAHFLRLTDLSFLACGVGPGSYTGIRSAAATVKGVVFTTQLPVVAVPSLLLYAPLEDGSYLVTADGGIGGVFVQEIEVVDGECRLSPPELVSVRALHNKRHAQTKIIAADSQFLSAKGLEEGVPALGVYRETSPHTALAARFACQEMRAGRHYTAAQLPLLYLRKTQAEIERGL